MTAPPFLGNGTTYVIGHKNPDADSICAAIAYAALKERRGDFGYVAARCGNSNARIDKILARFQHPLPVYLSDVSPRVRDLMNAEVVSVTSRATCAEALELIDRHDIRLLPVTGPDDRVIGTVSLPHLGGIFIPRLSEPRLMRQVYTSLGNIVRSLRGAALHLRDENTVGQLFVRLGTMDIKSFWKVSERENIPAGRSVIIVGDRRDIQERAIEIGVRALIVTSNLAPDPDIVARAQAKGVSVILSPHDSATTAWVVRTASLIERVVETDVVSVHPDARIEDVRPKLTPGSGPAALMVLNDQGALVGVLSRSDVLKPVKTRLVLVDHNEITQAVPGADQVTITEIIDHHRLGALNTAQPILFINEPVGSTCTIIADLFRREQLTPDAKLAGIMMSGIISDTLNLKGPTTTPKDATLLEWLSGLAGLPAKDLADAIFSSGSVILANPPAKVVRSDFKVYEEEGVRFAVSQVEELGLANFWRHARDLATALQELRQSDDLSLACLLVTDINTQNSLLMVKGEVGLIQRISYAHVEKDEIFDLPGIVSRKKQLIPYLTSLFKEMAAEGAIPRPSAKSRRAS